VPGALLWSNPVSSATSLTAIAELHNPKVDTTFRDGETGVIPA
jgi:hypothetical protein